MQKNSRKAGGHTRVFFWRDGGGGGGTGEIFILVGDTIARTRGRGGGGGKPSPQELDNLNMLNLKASQIFNLFELFHSRA